MGSKKDAYHHGNLHRALMDEAIELIGEKGVDNLSLREVAARAGVSHAAPYHHFADKTALVREIAFEGMARMDRSMAAAQADAPPNPVDQLLAIGLAYVEFAIDEPAYYAAFASPEVAALSSVPSPEQAGEGGEGGTWERLVSAVLACQAAGELPQGDPVVLAVYLWSLVHGFSELWRTGPLRYLPHAADGPTPLAREVLSAAIGSVTTTPRGDAPWAD